jgi:hypothetical protein
MSERMTAIAGEQKKRVVSLAHFISHRLPRAPVVGVVDLCPLDPSAIFLILISVAFTMAQGTRKRQLSIFSLLSIHLNSIFISLG